MKVDRSMIDTETRPLHVPLVRCQSETLADTTNEHSIFKSPRSVGGYREDRGLVSKDFHNWTGFFLTRTNPTRWSGHIQTQPALNSMSGPMDGPEGYDDPKARTRTTHRQARVSKTRITRNGRCPGESKPVWRSVLQKSSESSGRLERFHSFTLIRLFTLLHSGMPPQQDSRLAPFW